MKSLTQLKRKPINQNADMKNYPECTEMQRNGKYEGTSQT